MQRQPVVAGQFYPENPTQLHNDLAKLIQVPDTSAKVIGIIAPHAGYMYSGSIAGRVYGQIQIPETVLIIGPNHHGVGESAALFPDGEWLTPLGPVAINSRLNALIKKHAPSVSFDTVAHQFEHSLEVQVPFLQARKSDVTIAALCIGTGSFPLLHEIGSGIASAVREYGKNVLMVASSDMTHYESAVSARIKDNLALEKVLAFDPEGLLRVCRMERITMCGVAPVAIMLVAASLLGATTAEMTAYGTSGDVTGDNRQVVAYAAVTIQ